MRIPSTPPEIIVDCKMPTLANCGIIKIVTFTGSYGIASNFGEHDENGSIQSRDPKKKT